MDDEKIDDLSPSNHVPGAASTASPELAPLLTQARPPQEVPPPHVSLSERFDNACGTVGSALYDALHPAPAAAAAESEPRWADAVLAENRASPAAAAIDAAQASVSAASHALRVAAEAVRDGSGQGRGV